MFGKEKWTAFPRHCRPASQRIRVMAQRCRGGIPGRSPEPPAGVVRVAAVAEENDAFRHQATIFLRGNVDEEPVTRLDLLFPHVPAVAADELR